MENQRILHRPDCYATLKTSRVADGSVSCLSNFVLNLTSWLSVPIAIRQSFSTSSNIPNFNIRNEVGENRGSSQSSKAPAVYSCRWPKGNSSVNELTNERPLQIRRRPSVLSPCVGGMVNLQSDCDPMHHIPIRLLFQSVGHSVYFMSDNYAVRYFYFPDNWIYSKDNGFPNSVVELTHYP